MSTIELSAPARQALIALLVLATDATNPMLKERFRLEIKKKEREELVAEGLITIPGQVMRANVHRLTTRGRAYACAELGRTAPAGTGYGVHLLYAVANVLDRVAREYGLDVEKVMQGGAQVPPPAPNAASVEDQILGAYASLAKRHGDLVSLVHLRGRLSTIDRGVLDRTLKAMDRSRMIQLEPDPNRGALPPEAHEAAIRIGGEDKHFVTVGHR